MSKPRYYAHGFSADEPHPFQNGTGVPTVMDRETGETIAHVITPEAAGLVAQALNVHETLYTLESLDGTEDAADWLTVGHVLDAQEVDWLRHALIAERVLA